jgi:hypothetical protein
VIAHNAYFDRAMVERHWNCFAEKPWVCTLNSVDWLREGFPLASSITSACSSAGSAGRVIARNGVLVGRS